MPVNKKAQNSTKLSWIVVLTLFLALGTCIAAFFMPFMLTRAASKSSFDFSQTGQIGDTIGGTTAPFIGIAVALLTFSAFWVQYEFNKQQNARIDEQERKSYIESFETRFYDLLKIHRENLNEITIKNVSSSRRAFVSMFKEFLYCYLYVKEISEGFNREKNRRLLTADEMINISYLVFMYGIGESSNRIIESIFGDLNKDIISEYLRLLDVDKTNWYIKKKSNLSPTISIREYNNVNKSLFELTILYSPFDGHLSRLNHYFRHLYTVVKYVDEQDEIIITLEKKMQYIKTLRAQLSIHEQLLIYYNSLTVLGQPWADKVSGKSLLEKYKLIKNIPLPLADIGEKIESIYSEKDFFEWNEIQDRLKQIMESDKIQ